MGPTFPKDKNLLEPVIFQSPDGPLKALLCFELSYLGLQGIGSLQPVLGCFEPWHICVQEDHQEICL